MFSIDLLHEPPSGAEQLQATLSCERQAGARIIATLAEFKVTAYLSDISAGPVVTSFALTPAPGVRASRILNLADDLSLRLQTPVMAGIRDGRIVIDVPNSQRQTVFLRDVFSAVEFARAKMSLPIALGKYVDGKPAVADLATMPHLLIAGATNSGKSIGLHAVITSLLYRSDPSDVRLVLIDPKMVELQRYATLPHLMDRGFTDATDALRQLRSMVDEMELRYELLSAYGVRSIESFNAIPRPHGFITPPPPPPTLPRIVIVIDEFGDLMIGSDFAAEDAIIRLAQKARAVGIHLVIATQRPTADVVTGLIKANFPCRIAYRVASKIDSRVILDRTGAERLLGRGDSMLLTPAFPEPVRIHGTYVDDIEIDRVVNALTRGGDAA